MITKVIGWTSRYSSKYKNIFEYPYNYTKKDKELAEQAVIRELREHGYMFSGTTAQGIDHTTLDLAEPGVVPVFDDNTTVHFTLRQWGNIMQKAYPDQFTDYMDWYMGVPEGYTEIVPELNM